jgi:hypothetical protein
MAAVDIVVSNCPHSKSRMTGPSSIVKLGDARRLDAKDGSVDLVLTSPPYMNAIDYMRCSKFSLVWMGYNIDELRKVRGQSVGAENSSKVALDAPWVRSLLNQLGLAPTLSTRDYGILSKYVWDMGHALAEVSRVLRPGGRAVYVVGDSMGRGTFIPNSSIVTAVAQEHGLSLMSRQSRALPPNRRYLPPPKVGLPSAALDTRMRREIVLAFRKPLRAFPKAK